MAEDCSNSLCAGVVLCPDADELVEVVRAEDGGVPGEVVEVVHDDGHEEVEHDEGAKGGQFNTLRNPHKKLQIVYKKALKKCN